MLTGATAIVCGTMCVLLSACAGPSKISSRDNQISVTTLSKSFSNAHLLKLPQGAILIDSGAENNAVALANSIRELGTDPQDLLAVFITHGHADHAGGAGYFQQQFGVPLIGGKGDAAMFTSGENDALCPTGWLARRMLASAQRETYIPLEIDFQVDRTIALGELLGNAELPGIIFPIPGHTPGTLALVVDDTAFVGDIFRGRALLNGAARHFFMCDIEDNNSDIKTFLDGPAREVELFFTGHLKSVGRASVIKLVAD